MSDEDEMESDKESKDDKSSSESDLDSEELMGSTGMSDSPKDTELELDSLGMIALEGETSSGMIERAVDVLDPATPRSTSVDNFQVSEVLTFGRVATVNAFNYDLLASSD